MSSSTKSAILGDSDFPKSAESLVKGGRIELFQFIYERYSTLAFTRVEDRPVAISGLEKRLIRTFNTDGAHGVFDTFLARSLLWKRGGNEMSRISYPSWRTIPSWSWMAYDGRITYVDVPFGQVHWLREMKSPFAQDPPGSTDNGNGRIPPFELLATATDLSQASPRRALNNVTFDLPGTKHLPECKCVIIGTHTPRDGREKQYYVLVVAPASPYENPSTYERVGAGTVEKHQLDLQGKQYEIRIR